MRFNSIIFIEFALIFFLGWALIGRKKPAALWYLVLASWVFYGFATWWFVPILVLTGTVDWAMALAMAKWPSRKKGFVITSCVSNLGVLVAFKYSGFFAQSLNEVFALQIPHSIPFHSIPYSGFFAQSLNEVFALQIPIPKILLPIGISFYTFQSLSYVFDVCRGKTEPTKSWLEFLAIVSLFAHLVAGPIVRVSKILPQIRELKKPSPEDLWTGLDLICIGFFKKIVLADRLGGYVDIVYSDSRPSGITAILGTIAFAFQIYFDFGGYTDIARGFAKWLGLDFGVNFNHPYGAIGMADFWTRWHISLSSWVRDYLYIPLGGNRAGVWKAHRNLWISMVLAGLWHGANSTFVVWGVLHATYLSIERITEWPKRLGQSMFGRFCGIVITFAIVCVGWVFFRADSIPRALEMLGAMASPFGSFNRGESPDIAILLILAGGILYEFKVFYERRESVQFQHLPGTLLAVRNGVLLALCIVAPGTTRTFIYFQF